MGFTANKKLSTEKQIEFNRNELKKRITESKLKSVKTALDKLPAIHKKQLSDLAAKQKEIEKELKALS